MLNQDPNQNIVGMLSGLPIEKLVEMVKAKYSGMGQQGQPLSARFGPPPMAQMPAMAAPQPQEQNPMGMLGKMLPFMSGMGRTATPQSVLSSTGNPLTVPAGSMISDMAPGIANQLSGGSGAGWLGLLKGLF